MYDEGKKPRKLTEEYEAIKDRIIRDIKSLFEQIDYYEPVRVGNFHSNDYIEYESKSDRNKILSIKEQLEEIKLHLKIIMNNLKKLRKTENSIKTAINFISSKDIDEERVMHLKSDSIKIMIYDKADQVIK